MRKQLLILLMVPALIFTACKKDDDTPPDPQLGTLELNMTNLAPSDAGEQYEGWIVVNGTPVSTGTFTVNANGDLSQSSFMLDPETLDLATDFVLSIEPMPDNDPESSAIKILGGSFSGNTASATVAHPAALGDDFMNVMGKYILATPTTATMDDENSGVWFLDINGGSPIMGLELPDLPSGWKYEGWAVVNGMPVSSGTFSMVDAMDDSAPYSGINGSGPPFPGEDYVMNAPSGLDFPTDLSEGVVVISIEPSPDNSPNPFAFKPLVGHVPANAEDHKTYDMMDNVAGSFPSGTVSR